MKKQVILGLLSLVVATSAYASGSAYMNCTVGSTVVAINLNEEAKGPDTASGDVSIQDSKGNELGTLASASNDNYGTYVYADNNGNPVENTVKISFKGKNGSVVNIQASGPKGKGQGSVGGPMGGRMTLVVHGADADQTGLKNFSALRSVPVTCQYDFE